MRRSYLGWWILGSLVCVSVVSSCTRAGGSKAQQPGGNKSVSLEHPIIAVATTGMVANAVAEVGGPFVRVGGLMGPGVDPHLYKASEGDIERLSGADIIFYNGLNLEGKMGDIFVKMARGRDVVALAKELDPGKLREPPEFLGHYDPHIWFDVGLWSETLTAIGNALAEFDPAHVDVYRKNVERYRAELMTLDAWCRAEISRIPKEQRLLVTAHDAFGYFGRAYDIQVLGLQGISTVSEYGLKDVQRLVDVIVTRKIRAVFVESSVPKRSIEAVVEGVRSRGHQVAIGGQLYSDAMGTPGTPEGTYIGMVRANVTTIVQALLGSGGDAS